MQYNENDENISSHTTASVVEINKNTLKTSLEDMQRFYTDKIIDLEAKNKLLQEKLKLYEKKVSEITHPKPAVNISADITDAENFISQHQSSYNDTDKILSDLIIHNEQIFPSRNKQVKMKMAKIIKSYLDEPIQNKPVELVITKYLLGEIH